MAKSKLCAHDPKKCKGYREVSRVGKIVESKKNGKARKV